MDVEEAHKRLGLYSGAPRKQVDAAFANLAMNLKLKIQREEDPAARDEFQSELEQLEAAHEICLGGLPPAPAQTSRGKGVRGPIVLAVMTVGMIAIASTSFIGVWYFNQQRAEREVVENARVATEARNAWEVCRAGLDIEQPDAAHAADDAFDNAVKLERAGDNAEAAELYREALNRYYVAFDGEDKRLKHAWQTEVVKFWTDNLQGRFPFNPTSGEDASTDDVATLLNPVDGRLWTLAGQLDVLTAAEFAGRKAVSAPDGYRETLKAAASVRDALFPDGTREIDVRFELAVVDEAGSAAIRLEFAGRVVAARRAAHFTELRWRGRDGGARLEASRRLGDRTPFRYLDYADSDWGLLRVIRHADETEPEGNAHGWSITGKEMEGEREVRRDVAARILIRTSKTSPFNPDLYAGVRIAQ